MGLDIVELVMSVEDEFKIAIADAEAERCETVGNLVDFVYSRVRKNTLEPCPSQHGFYVVRKKLVDIFGVNRSHIGPESPLDEIFGRKDRRASWQKVLSGLTNSGTDWPRLKRPRWLNVVVLLVVPGIVLIASFLTLQWVTLEVAIIFGLCTAGIGHLSTLTLENDFPEGFRLTKNLIKFVKTLDQRIWSRDGVFKKIRQITVENLGVDESAVTENAHFVRDLGAG